MCLKNKNNNYNNNKNTLEVLDFFYLLILVVCHMEFMTEAQNNLASAIISKDGFTGILFLAIAPKMNGNANRL